MSLLDRLNQKTSTASAYQTQQCALTYIRVSHADSAERGTSLETQRRDIQKYADANNITILSMFEEPAKSAFKNLEKRTEFLKMIAEAKANPAVNLIIVWKSDRFCRNRRESAAIKHDLMQHGVRVVSVTEHFDPSTVEGVVMESITETIDQVRSMELSKVIKRNLATNAEQRDPNTGWAHKNGGLPLFGFKNERVYKDQNRAGYQRAGHTIWLLNDTVINGKPIYEWVRVMLVDWRLKEQLGYAKIAERLTTAGIPTARGAKGWSASTVSYMLTWDKLYEYAGYGFWGKDDNKDRRRSPDEWTVIPNAHPAIITEDEAEKIDAIKLPGQSSRFHTKRTKNGRWLLTGGLMVCGSCGMNWTGNVSNKRDWYVCGTYKYRRGVGCGPYWQIDREDLETAVLKAIAQAIPKDKKKLIRIVDKINKDVIAEIELYKDTEAQRIKKIEELNQEIERLTMAIARGVSESTIEEQINHRAAEKARLEVFSDYKPPQPITIEQFNKLALRVWEAYTSANRELKRQVIREWVLKLEAFPERRELILTLRNTGTESEITPIGWRSEWDSYNGSKTRLIVYSKKKKNKLRLAS